MSLSFLNEKKANRTEIRDFFKINDWMLKCTLHIEEY